MNEEIIITVCKKCRSFLKKEQLRKLEKVLTRLNNGENKAHALKTNDELFSLYLESKNVEGCSKSSMKLYTSILSKFMINISKPLSVVNTEDIRKYLSDYQTNRKITKLSLDNIRRVLSSLFRWLEDEDYILKNPMRRIHKIKSSKKIKEAFSDEHLNLLKDKCLNNRDLAIIEMLSSTGIRVGELVKLNIDNVDLDNRECIVFGKGSKERKVYFDTSTKMHLTNYLNNRVDDNEALFVSRLKPHKRLQISGVEIALKKLGLDIGIQNVHPHRFRRTLATRAIDKGMPIEQVQALLGHSKIDTTMTYAIVNQNNVKNSYRKIIG